MKDRKSSSKFSTATDLIFKSSFDQQNKKWVKNREITSFAASLFNLTRKNRKKCLARIQTKFRGFLIFFFLFLFCGKIRQNKDGLKWENSGTLKKWIYF